MPEQMDLSRVDLNLLVVFEVVFRERHVGRAGQRLNLSPSAVSHSLGRLRRMFNDPLFLRTPKGVNPSDRAQQLAPQVADLLEAAQRIVAAGAPFDPAQSVRKFVVGVPDGEATLLIPSLPTALSREAPGVDLSVRTVMPQDMLASLDAGHIDVAVTPYAGPTPARFHLVELLEQNFVIAMRRGHTFGRAPDLESYCQHSHAVMSITGDAHGFIDDALARLDRRRRIALTLPSFLSILAALEHTDLLAAAPRGLVERFADHFGLTWVEAPLGLDTPATCAIATQSAMRDSGVAWLMGLLRAIYAS